MTDKPILYRKRLIPNECIRLDQDEILLHKEQLLVTRWNTIRPKKDLDHGISCFLLDKGWKISQFINREDQLICWYCDIIDWSYDSDTDTYVFTDLLADVLIYPSGQIRVVDLDEIADAMEQGLLDQTQLCLCMRRLDALLREIYSQKLLPSLESYWLL
ncbi:MAG: DUF402 domain-containing protein [Lachnospiraceae bacterium]|jgi:hypothetical protein|uniref:DUF402 domain-containing protein n=1 Tax=Candidatus Merdisoma sp. JLR.KK006 TaxID=3112626 RepID=UPI002FF05FCE|nr:DUF402 domain-containing protein [Lachnospiraceae bacterium]